MEFVYMTWGLLYTCGASFVSVVCGVLPRGLWEGVARTERTGSPAEVLGRLSVRLAVVRRLVPSQDRMRSFDIDKHDLI